MFRSRKNFSEKGPFCRIGQAPRRIRESYGWLRLWKTLPVWSWIDAADNFRRQNFSLAAAQYRKGLAQNPKHPARMSAELDLAYCLYRLGEYDEAQRLLRRLVSGNTCGKDVYLLAARIQMILGRALSAAYTLRACLENFPNDAQVLSCYMHAALYSCLGIDELDNLKRNVVRVKARLSLDDQRNLHLDTALAHFEIAYGDVRNGERLLARVLATGEAPFEAVLIRGERLLEQGRLLQAREQLERAMTACPKDPRPVLLLAKSYLRNGEDAQPTWAKQLAEAACRLSSWENAECLNVLARAYEANDQKANAQLFYERMKSLPSMDELGVAYFESSLQMLRSQKLSTSSS